MSPIYTAPRILLELTAALRQVQPGSLAVQKFSRHCNKEQNINCGAVSSLPPGNGHPDPESPLLNRVWFYNGTSMEYFYPPPLRAMTCCFTAVQSQANYPILL
ncbi:hypothetical protein XENTR_v10000305 [Xenopus tropicalis]|nr:hypothetical protein XENTR_v10000305 [Xenopus tropicalis]